jgi:hypothetical protein
MFKEIRQGEDKENFQFRKKKLFKKDSIHAKESRKLSIKFCSTVL